MATSAPRPSSSSSRRSSSSFNAPTSASIARGATARSAVSHKVNASLNGINRRGSVAKTAPAPVQSEDPATDSEGLLSALKKETEEKEELLVRIQDKDQSIAELTKENSSLTTTLNAAETRLNELYADQARIEEETVARLELVDRLRSQVQELEREKRDILRRYNEQTATFDAERQSFYDNEQHLKSRIQSLAQARKASEVNRKVSLDIETDEVATPVKEEYAEESQHQSENSQPSMNQKADDGEDDEPAEMTALRLELSTLSTSYSSLQTTVQHLSAQLLDLKRVNNQLQEENESYNILLREKTITGQFDILRTVGTGESEEDSGEELPEDEAYGRDEQTSIRSRTPLDPVDELAEDMDASVYMDEKDDQILDEDESADANSNHERTRAAGRKGRRAPMPSHSPVRKGGESLADLPVAGPGLDLAAELGRAENLAFLEGQAEPGDSRSSVIPNNKGKLGKKKSIDQKALSTPPVSAGVDLDALRNEVKSLKDANKALSLYASKIIDRIIAQEGFEHVLAADYEKVPASPVKKTTPPTPKAEAPKKKARPQSAIFGLNFQNLEPTTTSSDPPKSPIPQTPVTAIPTEVTATTRTQRRSMSFDWRSMFGGAPEKKPEPNPNLRPLNLRPGAPTVVTARKLDTLEDEEDQKERERLNAVMKLMGIEKPPSSVPPSPYIGSPSSSSGTPMMISTPPSEATSPKPAASNRFSFFRSRSNTSETSVNSGTGPKPSLTAEALERAEAETSLAALDEREKALSAEIAKGSNGGFTDLPSRRQRNDERRSWRSKRSGESGSGSTVWSAGMSTHREESGDEGAARS